MDVNAAKKTGAYETVIENPLKTLHSLAERLSEEIESSADKKEKQIIGKLLLEILKSQAHFLTGIFVSIYLQDDYKKVKLDASVSHFLKNSHSSYNELIGLCETLSIFLKKNQDFEKKYGKDFSNIPFDKIRLKAPPLSDAVGDATSHLNIRYHDHIKQTIDKLLKSTTAIANGKIEILLHAQCKDDSMEFKNNARQIIRGHRITEIFKNEDEINETGSCRLILPVLETNIKIQLDPVIIPLKNGNNGLRLASILYIGAYQSAERCILEYRELSGDGTVFSTNDERLTRGLYFKKGNVSESPEFQQEFNLFNGRLKLQLYMGDIFDLNFIEDMGSSALVNIMYNDLRFKTPLSKRLEMLSGSIIKKDLEDRVKIKNGNIYAVKKNGALNFNYIMHSPVYDVHHIHLKCPKESNIDIIRQSIANIIDECTARKIETLIAPAMGSFWAGQTREEVATIWCDEIKRLSSLQGSRLKRIIFSFINKETFNVYRNCIRSNTDELYKDYQLPVASLHNDMLSQTENLKRLDRALDLSEYLYSFLIAWAIRSIMLEKIENHRKGELFFIKGKKARFLQAIKESFGYGSVESFRGLTPGIWQQLCEMGFNAIKNDEWGFDNFFPQKAHFFIRRKDKLKLTTFHNFIKNTENFNFPKWRNDIIGHATWHYQTDENLKSAADKAVNAIKEVIKNMDFLDQKILTLIKVIKFEVNEDAAIGRLFYYDLRGNGFDYIQRKSIKRKISDFRGTIFEENKVYLIQEHETIRSMLLHPFVLYGACPGCHRKTIFVWRDNRLKLKEKKGIKYGSIACECRQIDTDPIAGFTQSALTERFEYILNRLNSEKEEDI